MILLVVSWSALWVILYSFRAKLRFKGGEISISKKFWMSFALFVYYPLPAYLILKNGLSLVLAIPLSYFFLRLVVQGTSMYIFKNWTPKWGILFNVCTAPVMLISMLVSSGGLSPDVRAYAILLVACTSADIYYAYAFWQIAGDTTKGNNPIWFASDTKEYATINKVTTAVNFLLYGFFAYSYFPYMF